MWGIASNQYFVRTNISPAADAEVVIPVPEQKPPSLFRCHACHTTFLTEIDLTAQYAKCPEASHEDQPNRPEHRTPRSLVKRVTYANSMMSTSRTAFRLNRNLTCIQGI